MFREALAADRERQLKMCGEGCIAVQATADGFSPAVALKGKRSGVQQSAGTALRTEGTQ